MFLMPVPSESPRNVTGKTIASNSFNVSWTEIPYKERNGVILKYLVTYKETEGYARWQDAYATKMNILITGVEEYFNYTVRVAGVTSKGIGVLSRIIYVKTKQDGMANPLIYLNSNEPITSCMRELNPGPRASMNKVTV